MILVLTVLTLARGSRMLEEIIGQMMQVYVSLVKIYSHLP